ncbi:MAG: HNH endonuclease [Pseudomonadota bacterium]|nr:HNH endonuclease [Pseudomonadota bacterium]
MRASLRRLMLLAARSDALAKPTADGWRTRCLHCRSELRLRADGMPLGSTSLEHVIARAWFGRRAAASLTSRVGDHADDPRNLALACARCNHDKGKGHDARGPGQTRGLEVVGALLDARLDRWREPDSRPPG